MLHIEAPDVPTFRRLAFAKAAYRDACSFGVKQQHSLEVKGHPRCHKFILSKNMKGTLPN